MDNQEKINELIAKKASPKDLLINAVLGEIDDLLERLEKTKNELNTIQENVISASKEINNTNQVIVSNIKSLKETHEQYSLVNSDLNKLTLQLQTQNNKIASKITVLMLVTILLLLIVIFLFGVILLK